MKSYLKQGLEEGVSKSHRVRVLVLGHQESGKSSLIDSLTLPLSSMESVGALLRKKYKVKFRSEKERTWMVDPRQWKHKDIIFSILDFPGQPEYYATNRFFFSTINESVVMIVVRLYPTDWSFDGEKAPQDQVKAQLHTSSDQVRFWLNIISEKVSHMKQSVGGSLKDDFEQEVLIVATCGDMIDKKLLSSWLENQQDLFSIDHISLCPIMVVNALDRKNVQSVRDQITKRAQAIISDR